MGDPVVFSTKANNEPVIFYAIPKDMTTPTYNRQWGSTGSGNGEFDFESYFYVQVYKDEVYVSDYGNNRIQVFQQDGTYVRQWARTPVYGLAIYNDEVYVASPTDSKCYVTTLDGTAVRDWACPATTGPGITVSDDGEVYIIEYSDNKIYVYDINGNLDRSFGEYGGGDGQFNFPFDLEVYNGELYVADSSNRRVQVLSTAGVYIRQWDTNDSSAFNGISLYEDRVYVTHRDTFKLEVYDLDGVFIEEYGDGEGSGDGQFITPWGVDVYEDEIYVCDGMDQTQAPPAPTNDRIQVFRPGTYPAVSKEVIFSTKS